MWIRLLLLLCWVHTIHGAIFDPISTVSPNITVFPPKMHPIIPVRVNVPGGTPIPTSSWWSDWLLPQTSSIFTRIISQPYQLRYRSNLNSGTAPFGIISSYSPIRVLSPITTITTLSNITKQRIQLYTTDGNDGIGLSAVEHTTSGQSLEVIGWDLFSVTVRLFGAGGAYIMPLIHGMMYTTAKYTKLTPFVFTQGFRISTVNGMPGMNLTTPLIITDSRFRLTTTTNTTWIVYSDRIITMTLTHTTISSSLTANMIYDNIVIRVAISDGSDNMERILDAHADTYATGGNLDATVGAGVPQPTATPTPTPSSSPTSTTTPNPNGTITPTTITPTGAPTSPPTTTPTTIPTKLPPLGTYVITWNVVGTGTLLHWALPHHMDCLDPTLVNVTSITLLSTNKGMMTGIIGNTWTLRENSLTDYAWLPPRTADPAQLPNLRTILNMELDTLSIPQDPTTITFGRRAYRAAQLLLVAETLLPPAAFSDKITLLQNSLITYLFNRTSLNKLTYDTIWHGICSDIGYTNINGDNGNTYYHEHETQYGYIIGTAAIMAHFDSTFVPKYGSHIDTFIRDIANPSNVDPFFPTFRYFDWYLGHSLTRGLTTSDSGRSLSSASETISSYYSVYLWGLVTNRVDLQNMGNMMMGIARRVVNRYIYITIPSDIHPPLFQNNTLAGSYSDTTILTTIVMPEKIHTQHIRPIIPISELIRYSDWANMEWENILGRAAMTTADLASRSLALLSFATFNPSQARQNISNIAGLDETLSRSFALYWVATRPPPGTITRPVAFTYPSTNPPTPSPSPSTPTDAAPLTSTRSSSGWGWIIGTIIGLFFGIGILVILCVWYCVKRDASDAYMNHMASSRQYADPSRGSVV